MDGGYGTFRVDLVWNNLSTNAGLITGLGRSPEEGHGNPLQYSCLENSMDKGAWWSTVHRVTGLEATEVTEHAYILTFQLGGMWGATRVTIGKEQPTSAGDKRCGLDSSVRKSPWRRKWKPTPAFLPWWIPWTEESGGLRSMKSQRVRHNWIDNTGMWILNLWRLYLNVHWSICAT